MKTVTTWALVAAVVALCWVGNAWAVKPADTADKPFINVTTTPKEVDLGTGFMGDHEVKAAVTVAVEANCVHGPIYLSVTPLNRKNGSSIEPDRVSVRTAATDGYVAMKKPVAISQTTKGSHKVVVDVKVDTPAGYEAGKYEGVFTFMITPPV